MTAGLFSDAWATALGAALGRSDAYRQAARLWVGAVVLDWTDAPVRDEATDTSTGTGTDTGTESATTGDATRCGVYLDLHQGECRAARLAAAADYASARYVLSADLDAWMSMLEGRMSPTAALLRGKLALSKGSIGALMPHANAAVELIKVAQSI